MSRVKLSVAVALLGAVMTVSAVAVAGGGGNSNTRLSGFAEVPAVLTGGEGKLKLRIDRAAQEIDYVLRYEGLEGGNVLFAHIHVGQVFTNGAVATFLCGGGTKPAPCPPPTGGEVEGTIRPADIQAIATQQLAAGGFDEFVDAIRRGLTYGNVHTQQSPGGEIRGQIPGRDDD
jgi:hypothetical protein